MEGKEFLTIAQSLCGSSNEAERRTAVSRAYYALFNHVKRSLEVRGIPFKHTAEAHDQICRFLNNSAIAEAQTIAIDLGNLRTIRNKADYNLQAGNFDVSNCTLQCRKAENCLGNFDIVDLTKLVESINKYRQAVKE